MATIRGIPLYGQSLSVGVQGAPALTTTSHPTNRMLNLARTALVGLREGAPDFSDVETQASQTCLVGFTLAGDNVAFGGLRVGAAGASISELSEGDAAGHFAAFMLQVTQFRDLATAAGDNLVVEAVTFVQGAADQTGGNATYAANLLTLQGQIESNINTLLGTTGRIPLLVSQLSAYDISSGTQIALAQYNAAEADPDRIILVDSRCWYTAAADDLHGINTDYQRHGQKFGRAYHRIITQNQVWPRFAPYRVEGRISGQSDGMNTDLVLGVPEPPVRFSADVISQRTNQGVEFSAGGTILEDFASISSVAIPSGSQDTVRVGFSHPIGPGWGQDGALPQVWYAITGGTGNVMGAQDPDSPNGNIADSASANGGENNALHFALPVSRHWDPRPTSTATRSLLLDGTNEVVIPSGGASGAWNFTNRALLTFWFRINASPVHNTFLINRGIGGAQDWSVRLFTTGGNRFSVTFGGAANGFTSVAGDLPTGWNPAAILFDVDQAANADRVQLIIAGQRVTGTNTGAFPNTALAGDSTVNVDFGSSTGAGSPNGNICHVGWWTDMGSGMFTRQELWQSGLVRAPVIPDGTGGIPLPELFFPIVATDDPVAANGIDNAGTGGATYDGSGSNMVAGDLTTDVPPPTPTYVDAETNVVAASAWNITLPTPPDPPDPPTPPSGGADESDPGGDDGQPPVTPTIAPGTTTLAASTQDLDTWMARDDLGPAANTIHTLALARLRKDIRPLTRERIALITNAAGVNAWYLPDDFLAARSIIPLDQAAGTDVQKVTPDRRRRSRINRFGGANGIRQYSVEGSTAGPIIMSAPPPEASQVITIRLSYHRAMDSEADTEWYRNYHYDLWLHITQYYAAIYQQDLELSAIHMMEYEKLVAQCNRSENYSRDGGSPLTRSGGRFPV